MDIELDDQPFDLDFHPSASIVAVGLINGGLQLFRYEDLSSESERLWTVTAHTESCRAVRFVDAGRDVLTASPDCSILATNVETGQQVARLTNAHGVAVNRLVSLTDTTIASGDDDGTIKVWDTRQNSCCNKFKAHEDYISDMEFVPETKQLLGASGDGRLSVCNLRRNKVQAQSEFSEDELLSVVLMKHGRKVICGSQGGVLLLYSWGYFNDCSDRFLGHPDSVEALLKLDEDTLISGSSDGIIRVVSILPNKMIGVIGEHASYPIERLAFSHDRKFLGSVSHDHILKLWDVSYLFEDGKFGGKELEVAANDENEKMDLDVDIEKRPRGDKMVIVDLNKAPEEDESPFPIMLCKDDKIISLVHCYKPAVKVPESLHIKDIYPAAVFPLSSLPRIYFHAAGQNRFQTNEWGTFVSYLLKRDKVAVCPYGRYEFLIIPPIGKDPAACDRVAVAYRVKKSSRDGEVLDSVASADNRVKGPMSLKGDARFGPQNSPLYARPFQVDVKSEDVYVEEQNNLPLHARPIKGERTVKGAVTCRDFRECKEHNPQPVNEQGGSEITNPSRVTVCPGKIPNEEQLDLHEGAKVQTKNNFVSSVSHHGAVSQPTLGGSRQEISHLDSLRPSLVHTHPSYLETLGQNHAGWIFGAIAELIDNSRDATASRLDISIEMEYYRRAGERIPVLVMVDNGTGMSHSDIVRMLSFGHKSPEKENKDLIGRFGVGFKTGSMRLGRDVVVLTQSTDTRSIAFLSRSYNEDKNDVEIPIITYRKHGGWMDFDLEVHSEAEAMAHLKAIKDFSPFNEYAIGTKFAAFGEDGTGTQIYVYNLDMWGSDYSLQWDNKNIGEGNNFTKKRDIVIRSRRVRSRPGQMSQEVPLDYSLHAYLEVIFLDPRMKIFVQGTRVKSRPLAKSLNKTRVIKGVLLNKNVELILGRSQEERERGNCGIFLYWHGRLIEAYKRVGGMIHSADMGRGVIGVIDVTEIMNNGNGCVWVLNTKQGFQDSEAYAKLEQWLGSKADEYWDENFDTLELRDQSKGYKPDYDWVQCNKCRKWRILDPSFNSETLPDDWFCYMPPFKGTCSIAEQKVEPGVITVGAKRSSGGFTTARQLQPVKEEGNATPVDDSIVTTNNRDESEASTESEDDVEIAIVKRPPLKRLKRGPATRTMIQRRCTRH